MARRRVVGIARAVDYLLIGEPKAHSAFHHIAPVRTLAAVIRQADEQRPWVGILPSSPRSMIMLPHSTWRIVTDGISKLIGKSFSVPRISASLGGMDRTVITISSLLRPAGQSPDRKCLTKERLIINSLSERVGRRVIEADVINYYLVAQCPDVRQEDIKGFSGLSDHTVPYYWTMGRSVSRPTTAHLLAHFTARAAGR